MNITLDKLLKIVKASSLCPSGSVDEDERGAMVEWL
jgi:hypothetical protein